MNKGTPKLHEYNVIGWMRKSSAATERIPMRRMKIKASNALQAQIVYSRSNQMPRSYWDDGTSQPLIVILVERISNFKTHLSMSAERES